MDLLSGKSLRQLLDADGNSIEINRAKIDPSNVDRLLRSTNSPRIPVYAWMRWGQILSPTPPQFAALRPRLAESLLLAKAKFR